MIENNFIKVRTVLTVSTLVLYLLISFFCKKKKKILK